MKPIIAHINIQNVAVGAAALICTGSLLVVSSSMLFGGFPVFIYGLIVSVFFIGGYLGWKGRAGGTRWPKTGMELPLIACVLGLLISLAFSPNPQVGLQRAAQLIILIVAFFILSEVFTAPQTRSVARLAFLWVSGILSLAALLETYAWYLTWWAGTGSHSILPPFQYRFISLALHSSFYMMIANMCAPIAFVSLLKTKSKAARFGNMFWLATYVLAVLFSSSRAGWIGAVVWVITLIAFWFGEAENRAFLWERVLRNHGRRMIAGVMIGGCVLVVASLYGYQMFAGTHPSHGSATAFNREGIWDSAFTVIRSSPWVGAGPGQAAHKLLAASQNSPYEFWPMHAHSTPLQMLTEFGIVGFIPFLFLLPIGFYYAKRALRAVTAGERQWLWVSIAALGSVVVQGIFDDVTYPLFPMGLVVYHTASILYRKTPEQCYPRVALGWLAVPALFAFGVTVLNIWAYLPYHQAATLVKNGQWLAAARALEQSIQRDPNQPGYWNQAGMAWASVWRETGDSQALAAARNRLAQNLAIDPDYSLVWANLAVLDWQAGERDLALLHIQKAIALSPDEPTYWLNYGAFLEQVGQSDAAVQFYLKVIDRNPNVSSHPFWRSSPARKRALSEALKNHADESGFSYWMLARMAIEKNDFAVAQRNLAFSKLYQESSLSVSATQVELAKREGKGDEVRQRLLTVLESAESQYWGTNYYLFQLNFSWFPYGVVPGYMKIHEDGGQFDAMAELVQLQIQDRDCQAAEHTWKILQRELRAGELPAQGYPTAPACP